MTEKLSIYMLYVQWKFHKGGAPVQTLIAVIIAVIVTAIIVALITTVYHKNVANAKIGNADEKARQIIDDALKAAIDAYYEQYGVK